MTVRVPGSVARVFDNDGEFLLIESAFALPKWVQPETAEGRVFVYNGEAHVVPPAKVAREVR